MLLTTAEDARKLMPSNVEEIAKKILKDINDAVRVAAVEDRTYIRLHTIVGRHWDADSLLHTVVYEGKRDTVWDLIEPKLLEAGYKVRKIYEERQFVEIDISVSWR